MSEEEDNCEECVFCDIVKDKINAYKVYEDEKTIAFLDMNPVSRGHTLVIPKEHVETIHDAEGMNYMWDTIVKVSNSIQDAFEPAGMKINQNNGEVAGQEMFHLHFHITPVYNGSEIDVNYDREELQEAEEILDKIQEKMDEEGAADIYG